MISFFTSNLSANYDKLAYDFSFKDLDGSNLNLNEFKCPICRQLFTNSLPDKLRPVLENNMNGTLRTNSSVNRYNEIDFPPLR